jgi:hypothetical protein
MTVRNPNEPVVVGAGASLYPNIGYHTSNPKQGAGIITIGVGGPV